MERQRGGQIPKEDQSDEKVKFHTLKSR
jgi:hypothetical protein